MTAPDRIWACKHPYGSVEAVDYPVDGFHQYTRRTPAALAADPMVMAMVAAAMEGAVRVIDAKPQPCSPAHPEAWTDDQITHYETGQLDAAVSFIAALRACAAEEGK